MINRVLRLGISGCSKTMNVAEKCCQVLPLQFLAPGQPAVVEDVMGETADVHRLAELGLKPGVPLEMVQPGNPCIVRVAGSRLCFRESDLLSILVRLGEAA